MFERSDINEYDKIRYSESAKPITISYEEFYGLPHLDSAKPILNGILISYSFAYESRIIEAEYFINKQGLRQLIKLIDNEPYKLLVKHEYLNPEKSIIVKNEKYK